MEKEIGKAKEKAKTIEKEQERKEKKKILENVKTIGGIKKTGKKLEKKKNGLNNENESE